MADFEEKFPTPSALKKQIPLQGDAARFIKSARQGAVNSLSKQETRLVAIVGPCSIHDMDSALEYASRLKELQPKVEQELFLIMRAFVEKPRTKIGWRGFFYDPNLNGNEDIRKGLIASRELFLKLAEMGVPAASEILEPLSLRYFDDLLTWGTIGARTSHSPYHRQAASTLSFPVGFKNDLQGNCEGALHGITVAKASQSYLGLNTSGKIAVLHSSGNPHSHLILRGAQTEPNYEAARNLTGPLLIDCSHGNSGKKAKNQRQVLEWILENPSPSIRGFLLESHIHEGAQPLQKPLRYGVSITDECLGWEETKELLLHTSFCLRRSVLSKIGDPIFQ